MGRGLESVASARGWAPVENITREEAHPTHNEELEENVEIWDKEEVELEKDALAEGKSIPPVETMFAQKIMTNLKGSVGFVVLPTVHATQPPIVVIVPKVGGDVDANTFFWSPIGYCYDW